MIGCEPPLGREASLGPPREQPVLSAAESSSQPQQEGLVDVNFSSILGSY